MMLRDRHTLRARATLWFQDHPNFGGWALLCAGAVVIGAMVALCEGV